MEDKTGWEKALMLAGAKNAKALVMQANNFDCVKDIKCPRCGGLMGDVLLSFGKRKAMYCSKDRVVIPHPVDE